jgi:hypothetical protein
MQGKHRLSIVPNSLYDNSAVLDAKRRMIVCGSELSRMNTLRANRTEQMCHHFDLWTPSYQSIFLMGLAKLDERSRKLRGLLFDAAMTLESLL